MAYNPYQHMGSRNPGQGGNWYYGQGGGGSQPRYQGYGSQQQPYSSQRPSYYGNPSAPQGRPPQQGGMYTQPRQMPQPASRGAGMASGNLGLYGGMGSPQRSQGFQHPAMGGQTQYPGAPGGPGGPYGGGYGGGGGQMGFEQMMQYMPQMQQMMAMGGLDPQRSGQMLWNAMAPNMAKAFGKSYYDMFEAPTSRHTWGG